MEPDSFDIALGTYDRLRREKRTYGAGLINTQNLDGYDSAPEGSLATVVTSGNNANVYDPRAFVRLDQFELPYTPTEITISSNGYFLAITDGHNVNVFNFEGRNQRKAWNFDANVTDMAFSADNDEFAILTDDGVVNIYDTRSFLTKKLSTTPARVFQWHITSTENIWQWQHRPKLSQSTTSSTTKTATLSP